MQGQLVVWSEPKGFGFVQPDATTETSDRLFVHITNFTDADRKNVKLGARISFSIGDPIPIGKKPQAVHAKILIPAATVDAGVGALKAGPTAPAAPQSEVRS
jgi:cold shock CspA family protein